MTATPIVTGHWLVTGNIYLQGIDDSEIIDTVHARAAPMLPASAALR